ncbi:hypothetical protein Snoj_13460 [Streptomyces nojiriensis]|uniref:Uncharacterized protein n=1 Tax=Streptomyces nojiriensis TaxID=66374 RepID=A0ABQ3SH22_9ACTN|nr:hypothetical protein JYK04_06930 [Streptomyces nojiriensis]GGS09144.1 hypothetical protein GCM10010205_43290 [Streptomyces nojiriensis]GHI67428.1 hypothetical protein Snoj_13460 [Streptomyces nojiriensis]
MAPDAAGSADKIRKSRPSRVTGPGLPEPAVAGDDPEDSRAHPSEEQ